VLKEEICVVSAAAFNKFAKRPENEVFAISIKDLVQHHEIQKESLETDPKKLLPAEYHEWLDVCEKEASDMLPEHRSYDHYIDLEGNDPKRLGYTSLRNHSAQELEAIKTFITENLSKDFIRASTAPFAAPVLIVKKPHGGLRMCVDYRRLNEITRKDRYPLPLIEETLARFQGAKIFTKIDIRQAFDHRIRMHPDSEELTTFRTRYGTYCYRVLPFGLTNGPATFQRYINDVLMEYLDQFCSAYMDDILIYSQNLKEHKQHVKMILQKLREAGLQIDLKKCDFHVTETKFLGLIVTTEGIRMDPEKVRAIIEWEQPKSTHDVHSFLGFCNFYRRFIEGYADIAKPLNELLRKGVVFHWSDQCRRAFQALKEQVSADPLLRHFDRDKPAILETDSSDKAYGGVLSQYDENNILCPVAFLSKNLAPAECNYEIYDKELLAIVRCLEQWRAELEGTEIPIQVFTDHKALEYFAEKRKLTRRHARWAEILSQYNFKIIYRAGKQNAKADALSRRPNDPDPGDSTEQVLIPLERFEVLNLDEDAEFESNSMLPEQAMEANRQCGDFERIRTALDSDEGRKKYKDYAMQDGLLVFRGRLCVPADSQLITKLTREVHDLPASGHPGARRTLALLRNAYHWPKMRDTVERYVRNCRPCHRIKHPRDKYNGLLKPLPIPLRPWTHITCDFITGLPECQGYDAVLTIVDRFSKMRHYIPCKKTIDAKQLARLFIVNVWRYHGLPNSIVSDRGAQFISAFWKEFCRILGIKVKLSTAYHPETDGQSENANKELEVHLRAFVNYHQDDWVDWLPTAEFSDNINENASTKVAPFVLSQGYLPRMSFDWKPADKPPRNRSEAEQRKDAKTLAEHMDKIWKEAAESLKHAQDTMVQAANKKRKDIDYEPGKDEAYLS
jgi:transposase InsO family protein